MHELSIAEQVLACALETAAQHGAERISSLTVRAGAMQNIVTESLEMAFQAVAEGTIAEGAELLLEHVPVTARCRRCGLEFGVEDAIFVCPTCGIADVEMLTGGELLLMSLELESCA